MDSLVASSASHTTPSTQASLSLHEQDGSVKIQRMLQAERVIRRQRDHSKLNNEEIGTCSPNLVWREKVAQWYYGVVDSLNESRSVVYVAMNILDRYCAVYEGCSMDENTYELASMTAVFLAVRIAGSGSLYVSQLTSMSKGSTRVRDIVSMGTAMLKALTWDHRLITPLEFVSEWLELLPETNEARKQQILDSASYLVEIAVCDASFARSSPSDLALAAVLNALGPRQGIATGKFSRTVKLTTGVVVESVTLFSLRARLQGIYSQSADSREPSGPHLVPDDEEEEDPIQQAFHSFIATRTISHDQLATLYKDDSCTRKRATSLDEPSQLKRTKYTVPMDTLH